MNHAEWASAPVSQRSRFGDDIWELDIAVAGRYPDQNRLRWGAELDDGSRLTDPEHAKLLDGAKQFLWSMAIDPPSGRKRNSPTSLKDRSKNLIVIMRWMVAEGYRSFSALDAAAVERFRAWLRMRPGRKGRIAPATAQAYLQVLKDLYRQREKLDDAVQNDPLPIETTYEAAGLTPATKGAIPFIPDAIAADILSKAITWVEQHADAILLARDTWRDAYEAGNTSRRRAFQYAFQALKTAGIAAPDGKPIDRARYMHRLVAHLTDACFIVIAGFVGMRVSEILSIEAGAIEQRTIGNTGVKQAFIVARMFKTVDDRRGRVERWLAPDPVVRAVAVMERVSQPNREVSGRRELFLAEGWQQQVMPITGPHIGRRINDFAAHVGVPHHEGKPWPFSPHQFRKTFARFIARKDRSQLLALADHFKHASVAMTSKGYVGTDFDLKQLISHEGQAETAIALDRFLASDRLAGRMGERITGMNVAFRGRAGEQLRKDYIAFILAETDLGIHACDYGYCVFQTETSLCGGKMAPNEAGRSPAVCLSCSNFVVDGRHRGYWQERRKRNEELIAAAGPLTRAVCEEAIGQSNRVLDIIGERDNEKGVCLSDERPLNGSTAGKEHLPRRARSAASMAASSLIRK